MVAVRPSRPLPGAFRCSDYLHVLTRNQMCSHSTAHSVCVVNGAAWARIEVSLLPQVVELLPGGKVGYPGVCALVCSGSMVVGWSEFRQRVGADSRSIRAKSKSE